MPLLFLSVRFSLFGPSRDLTEKALHLTEKALHLTEKALHLTEIALVDFVNPSDKLV